MAPLGWAILAVLAAVVAVAIGVGVSVAGLLVFAAILGAWVGAGLLVKRDARRLGFDDSEWAASMVVVLGLGGLLWWFGYRRGRADAERLADARPPTDQTLGA